MQPLRKMTESSNLMAHELFRRQVHSSHLWNIALRNMSIGVFHSFHWLWLTRRKAPTLLQLSSRLSLMCNNTVLSESHTSEGLSMT